jgi:serine/threonine-protein kinase HSL1 (negative regulator of Swe1 kinase)
MKYRDDHLENYQGHGLEHSASDYHHKPPPPRKPSARQLHSRGRGHSRNRSQFSILSEDDPHARKSYYQDPVASETVESYDPFRPSLNPITDAKAEYANVTVLRGQPSAASRQRPSSARHIVASRVTALHQGHRVGSSTSVASSRGQSKRRIGAKQYGSKSSLASSSHRGASPIVIKPSDHHKRNINFSHASKSSGVPPPHERQSKAQKLLSTDNRYAAEGSPAPDAVPIPKTFQKKGGNAITASSEGGRRTVSHLWKEEARQVSNELEKFCDEVFNRDDMFNRSSITSSAITGNTSRLTLANEPSPVSSFTSREEPSYTTPKPTRAWDRVGLGARPLLPIPPRKTIDGKENVEYQNQFVGNQQQYLARPGPNGYLEDVIAHLDKLIQPGDAIQAGRDGRRIVSATPDCRSPDGAGYLPAISEEGRYSDADELQALLNHGHTGYRSVSAPFRGGHYMRGGNGEISTESSVLMTGDGRNTIRMVYHEPAIPDPVEPLNVRKKSAPRPDVGVDARQGSPATTWQKIVGPEVYKPNLAYRTVRPPNGGPGNPENWAAKGDGNQRRRGSRAEFGEGRVKGWFKRGILNGDDELRPAPPPKDDWQLPPMLNEESLKPKASLSKELQEPEIEKRYPHSSNTSWSGTKGFFKMFRLGSRKQGTKMAFGGMSIVMLRPPYRRANLGTLR